MNKTESNNNKTNDSTSGDKPVDSMIQLGVNDSDSPSGVVDVKTSDSPSDKPQKPIKLNNRDIAYSVLRNENLNNTQASEALGISRSRGSQISKKLDKKYDLSADIYLKPAARAIKNILKGKSFGEVKQIKDSTVLAAANMVYDRVSPVVKQVNTTNVNINFTKVDIGQFK